MNLTNNDHELLSAYLDGMLADDELNTLEQRLRQDPDLQRELQGLRQTIALVQNLPIRKAPRSFVLTPEMIGQADRTTVDSKQKPGKIIQFPTVSILSAVASLILSIAGLGLLLSTMQDTSGTDTTDNRSETVGILSNSVPADAVAVNPTTESELSAVETLLDTARSADPQNTFGYSSADLNLTATQSVQETFAEPPSMDADTQADEEQENMLAPGEPLPSEQRDRMNDAMPSVVITSDASSNFLATPEMQSTIPQTQDMEDESFAEEAPQDTANIPQEPQPPVVQATVMNLDMAEGGSDDSVEEMESADLYDAGADNAAAIMMPSPIPTQKPGVTTGGVGGGGATGIFDQNTNPKPPTPTAFPSPAQNQQDSGGENTTQLLAATFTPNATMTSTPSLTALPTAVAMSDGSGNENGQEMAVEPAPNIVTPQTVAESSDIQDQITLGGILLALAGLLLAFAAFTYLRQQGS